MNHDVKKDESSSIAAPAAPAFRELDEETLAAICGGAGSDLNSLTQVSLSTSALSMIAN